MSANRVLFGVVAAALLSLGACASQPEQSVSSTDASSFQEMLRTTQQEARAAAAQAGKAAAAANAAARSAEQAAAEAKQAREAAEAAALKTERIHRTSMRK